MKRLLLFAVAAIGLLATACTKDETAPVQAEMSKVTFAVAGPEMGTRTLGDGTTATDLYWAVYAEDGTYLPALSGQETGAFSALTANVEIDLVNGKKYQVIFWAQAAGAPYAFDKETKTLTVGDALLSNKEVYDAFYKFQLVDVVAGPRVETVKLTRPFAQLNIATGDTQKAEDGGLVVKQTKVVVNAYKTLNLEDGTVSNEVERTYDYADILTGEKINGYDLLSMNYLLVNEKELETVKFTVKNEGFEEEYTYENVPLQRNYRTNIIGNLLTSTIDFDIEILPGFTTPDNEYDGTHSLTLNGETYNSFKAALEAAAAGDELILNTDLELTLGDTRAVSGFYATISKDIVLNLNGKKIIANVPDVTTNSGIFEVKSGAEFTIKGEGAIHLNTGKAINCLSTFINNNAGIVNLVGDIDWTISACDSWEDALIPCFVDNNSNVGNATLNIYAGTFTFHRNLFRNFANAAGHNNYATVATINIYGGTFNGKADDAGAIWNQKPSGNTPDGAGVINVYGGTFNNVEITNDFTTGVNEESAQQAFNEAAAAADGEAIYLAPTEGGYTLPSFGGDDINIVGAGDGVILNMPNAYGVQANVSLENVEVKFSNNNYTGFQHTGAEYYKNCTFEGQPFLYGENVVFDNCTFKQPSADAYNVWTYGAKNVTFNGCTFESAGKSVLVYSESASLVQTVTFNDCVLNASAPVAGKAAIEIDSSLVSEFTVNINNTVANGFGLGSVSCNSLWNEKKGDNCTVNVDGVEQGKTVVFEQAGLAAALSAGLAKVNVAAGNYTMPEPDMRGKNITIVGSKDAVIDATAVDARDQFVTGTTLAFEGVTINFGTVNYMGFANCSSLSYKDCDINGLQFLFNTTTFENCKFNSNGAEHSVWTYSSKETNFTNCEFIYGDRCVNVYVDNGTADAEVNFTNCKFATANAASKGAVEINSSAFPQGVTVALDGCIAPANGEMVYISEWDPTHGATATVIVNSTEL